MTVAPDAARMQREPAVPGAIDPRGSEHRLPKVIDLQEVNWILDRHFVCARRGWARHSTDTRVANLRQVHNRRELILVVTDKSNPVPGSRLWPIARRIDCNRG